MDKKIITKGHFISKKCTGKWIVNIKNDEISVVRSDNELGIKSYGWGGDDKIIIAKETMVLDKLINVSNEVAEELNKNDNSKI